MLQVANVQAYDGHLQSNIKMYDVYHNNNNQTIQCTHDQNMQYEYDYVIGVSNSSVGLLYSASASVDNRTQTHFYYIAISIPML